MITASEPVEFIPRGRQAVEEHAGPLVIKKQQQLPVECMLLSRMQNVNLSTDNPNEFWTIQDVTAMRKSLCSPKGAKNNSNEQSFSTRDVNQEDELYVKGHTAVWTQGLSAEHQMARVCLTCESTIKFAFFCPPSFISTTATSETVVEDENNFNYGVGLLDGTCLKVYFKNGEDYVTAIENPISKVWVTRQALLMEKDPSNANVENLVVPMPRLFSLTHPLAEMSPILIKNQINCSYLVEADYKIIYSSYETDLVLMFDLRIGKHFVCRLRKATEDEIQTVAGTNETLNGTPLNATSNVGMHSLSGHHSFVSKGTSKHNNTGLFKSANTSSFHHQTNLSTSEPGTFLSISRTPIGSPLRNLQNSMLPSSSYQTLRKFDQIEPSKPIVPELCLEIIWTDNSGTRDFNEEASHGFIHTDFIGQSYLCYLLPHTFKLNLARMEKSHTPDTQVFGIVTSVPAKDAVELKNINMIAVLAPCGNVMLYSGPYLTGKVHISGILSGLTTPSSINVSSFSSFPRRSSLLPMSRQSADSKFDDELHMLSPVLPLQASSTNSSSSKTNCQELRDATGSCLTLVYPGKMYRINVPLVCESVLVTKCLETLRQVLQKELAIHLIIKWYGTRNAPGTKDFSPNKEWKLFMSMLFEQIGRPTEEFDNNDVKNEQTMEQDTSTDNSNSKRRKSDLISGTDADWQFLLNFHRSIHPDPRDIENRPMLTYKSETPLFSHIPLIFYTLHLLYEDLKLDTSLLSEIRQLAQLLHQLSIDLNLSNFASHYIMDFPELVRNDRTAVIKDADSKKLLHTQFYFGSEVPNLFKFVYTVICGVPTNPYPYIKDLNVTSKNIAQIMSLIFERVTDLSTCVKKIVPPGGRHELAAVEEKKKKPLYDDETTLPHKIIYHLIDMSITRKNIQSFPVAIHFILAQSLENSRLNPPIGCSAEAYKLLLRRELTEHANVLKKIEGNENNNASDHLKQTSISKRKRQKNDIKVKPDKKNEEDGMENTDTELLRLRFPSDLRINTVRTFLNSSKPVVIDIAQLPSVSDHEFIEEQEKQLFSLCIRTMALPVGRGMFTIRTTTPSCTESLSIPKLCLSGKEVNRGATIELQQIEVPANMTTWPQFHNGVAAGLKISAESKDIDSTWIIYNKPKTNAEQSSDHAGFLMALGLNGQLKSLSFMSIYEYLVKCDEMTNVGLLLGISATHRGTQDLKTTKLLSVHMEALLPPTAVELDIPQNIQIASLMGIGLVYQGTAKRHIAEVLLQEIGRPPGPEMENYVERESYALTAGLALGLVTLGMGEETSGLRDLGLSDTLHYYMVGGNKRPLGGAQKDKYKLPSFQIREGDTVNIDVTAPGATLALGLMFFNTGNEAVANWMKPPDTKFLLDFIRPDLLQLRIISKGLIMWDKVQPTTDWINSNVPASLAAIIKERPDPDDMNIEIDHEANCQAYCNIITGAAVCIGLRYAGTNDEKAFNTLKKVIDFFLNINTQWQYISEFTGKATIESCAIMVLLSLSLVCAGSGDLTILKMIRMMRSRIGTAYSQVTYGSHIAIHMALGFLFLGAGRYTLSRSPEAIAALVISLFPKFPNHSSDNRYHLQAFRHLYVLAIEPRLFLTRDIDTGKLALCNMTYIDLSGRKEAVAPCMLPELESLKTVSVEDSSYWPVYFDRQRNWDQLVKILQCSGCIDIKQRAGCFSHLEDPNRLKTILSQTLTEEQFKAWKIDPQSLLSFSHEENILNFTNKFIFLLRGREVQDLGPPSLTENTLVQKLVLLAYNCLTKDKMHALSIYVDLLNATRDLNISANPLQFVWQIKIIAKILEMYKHVNEDDFLLSYEILSSILVSIKERIENLVKQRQPLLKEYLNTNDVMLLRSIKDDKELNEIITILVFYGITLDAQILPQGSTNKLQIMAQLKKVGLDSEAILFIRNLFQL